MRWENLSRVNPDPGFIAPCLPSVAAREGAVRTGHIRFPLIVECASRLHSQSFYMDGEGVVCGDDGVAIFDELHGKANDHAVFLYAFDLLELDNVDLRPLPLEDRKRRLRALLSQKRKRIVYNEHLKAMAKPSSPTPASWAVKARVEAARSALPIRSREVLAQDREPE